MLDKTGIPTRKEINKITPGKERLAKGPVAIIECFQKIPCNPCYTSCPRGAIGELKDINDTPEIDHDKCNGCGICISNCPGLAIFVVDESYSPDKALVKLPYEFLPLPQERDVVDVLDREGKVVGKGKIIKTVDRETQDKTPVVWVVVDKELSMKVRSIRMGV